MKTPILTIYKRRLPHWRLDGSIYFITWRLAASQPPLQPEERNLVADAVKDFAGVRYDLLAYVVMDDHMHVLAAPIEKFSLEEIVHTWKSFTANRLQRNFGRTGRIWQNEYFDRIVRDEEELTAKVNYISQNPARRWPELEEYEWAWCDVSW
ncbi:MAG: transposase [Desulfomonile tiedjei]|nr:transposase [Desulfomonile tiedjei]